ncbi:MAG: alpha/beta hydrolase [Steroidobacteraceae bacterium]
MDRTRPHRPTTAATPPRVADLSSPPVRARARPLAGLIAFAIATLAVAGSLAPSAARAEAGKGQFDYIAAPDGVPLCVFETGNPKGKELLLIHGFSQSYAVFKLQYEGPLAKDHRIVAFDLRGHGCSGKPWAESAYTTTRAWADDVDAVIRARKLRRPLIVAWSFGGYVTTHYIKHHGTAGIAGAVMVGSNAGLPPPPTDPAAIARFEAAKAANARRPPDIEAGIADGHGFVKVMVVKPPPPDMAEIMFATNQMMPPYARRAMSNLPLQLDDVVPKMTTPVMLLVGEKDLSQSVEALTALAKRLPDGRVKVIPGAGHAAFIDAPQEFDADILEFEAYATGKR